MPKGGVSAIQVLRFVQAVHPPHIHLLGMGLTNHQTPGLLEAIRRISPATRVSMDSTLLAAAVGRRSDGSAQRALTAAQDRYREATDELLWSAIRSDQGEIDYTEEISSPSLWLSSAARERMADSLGLAGAARHNFLADPDHFLQEPIGSSGGVALDLFSVCEVDADAAAWWSDPSLGWLLDTEWKAYVHQKLAADRKRESVRIAFAQHPAAGQLFRPHTENRLPAAA
jgi:hypothetical protein